MWDKQTSSKFQHGRKFCSAEASVVPVYVDFSGPRPSKQLENPQHRAAKAKCQRPISDVHFWAALRCGAINDSSPSSKSPYWTFVRHHKTSISMQISSPESSFVTPKGDVLT